MSFIRSVLILCAVLLTAGSTFGQDEEPRRRKGSSIIDDSSKQVYGPKTSRYFYEEDVFYNDLKYHFIDTVIRNFHRYNYVQRNLNLYQDLGNTATPIHPIYFQPPRFIGATSGFQSSDMYWDSDPVHYYDTKSPYTKLNVVLGGKGRSMTKVGFTRNINPRWNFGFTYRALLIDKQVQRRGKGDRNVKGTYYDFYTSYQSKDSTYRLFFNFRRNFHRVFESGGVRLDDSTEIKNYFLENVQPWLTAAESNELRMNIHLFHQYQVFGKGFQVYHMFDRYRQGNRFIDDPVREPEEFFDFIALDSIDVYKVNDAVKFRTVRNEVGIKGNLLKLFYNGYYAHRQYIMGYKYLSADTISVPLTGDEHYLGGRIALKLDSIVEVRGWAEALQNGNYRLEGSIQSKWFEASLKQSQSAPGYVYQAYKGSHDVWDQELFPIQTSQLNGYLHYHSRVLDISPGVTFTRIKNYTYFKQFYDTTGQTVYPVQVSANHILAAPEFKFSLTMLRHINFSGQGIYTQFIENPDDAIRVPQLFVNAQLSYANVLFKGNLDMHAGVDVHWKSSYYAPAYDPAIQQFYNQDKFKVPAYPIVDLFLNGRIKRARIFVKYHNLMYSFTKSGYLPTPYYPGQTAIVDFGFDWSFYD